MRKITIRNILNDGLQLAAVVGFLAVMAFFGMLIAAARAEAQSTPYIDQFWGQEVSIGMVDLEEMARIDGGAEGTVVLLVPMSDFCLTAGQLVSRVDYYGVEYVDTSDVDGLPYVIYAEPGFTLGAAMYTEGWHISADGFTACLGVVAENIGSGS